MMLEFECYKCRKTHAAPEQFSGRRLRCRRCRTVLQIPLRVDVQDSRGEDVRGEGDAAARERAIEPEARAGEERSSRRTAFLRTVAVPQTRRLAGVVPRLRRVAASARRLGIIFHSSVAGSPRRRRFAAVGGGILLLGLSFLLIARVLDLEPVRDGGRDASAIDRRQSSAESTSHGEVERRARRPRFDPLTAIPRDVDAILFADTAELMRVGAIRDALLRAAGAASPALRRAGFELERDVRESWVGIFLPVKPSVDLAPVTPRVVGVIEGEFGTRKISESLLREVLAVLGSDRLHGSEVVEADPAVVPSTLVGAFLSEEQLLLASSRGILDTAARLEEVKSVRSNESLAALSDGFRSGEAFWLAAKLPDGFLAQFQSGSAESPSVPEIESVVVSIGLRDEGGIRVHAALHCASEEDLGRLRRTLQFFLGMFAQALPAELERALSALRAESTVTTLELSIDLDEEVLGRLFAAIARGDARPGQDGGPVG